MDLKYNLKFPTMKDIWISELDSCQRSFLQLGISWQWQFFYQSNSWTCFNLLESKVQALSNVVDKQSKSSIMFARRLTVKHESNSGFGISGINLMVDCGPLL